jgi:hypothetical protein
VARPSLYIRPWEGAMKTLTRREIEKRYPLSEEQQLRWKHRKALNKHFGGIKPPVIVGKIVELVTTRDRYDEMTGIMTSVRPPGHSGFNKCCPDGSCWYVWDGSSDIKTVWARDIFLVVEAES